MTTKTQFMTWAKDHPNFMTPYILKVEQVSEFFIELSEGTGLRTESKTPKIYGVTILEFKGLGSFKVCEGFQDLRGCFYSKTEANQQFLKAIMTVRKFCEDRNYTKGALK